MSKFMVHDERGNVWPPMFKSELCDPNSPHSMLSHKAKSAAAALAKATAAREAGKGWANGNMPHMNKPLIQGAKKAGT
jgi:hypothetical protein